MSNDASFNRMKFLQYAARCLKSFGFEKFYHNVTVHGRVFGCPRFPPVEACGGSVAWLVSSQRPKGSIKASNYSSPGLDMDLKKDLQVDIL